MPETTSQYNYHVDSVSSGTLLSDGTALTRHFKANEFEYFIQDSWRVKPNLTLTFGLRHTILQTPWETGGQQATPTIDTHTWFMQRESAALQGQVYEPNLDFSPTGPYYHKQGFWPKSKDNIAPRFAVVYAPDSKTSIRAGAGLYYDHYGEGLINTFDQNGSFGLSAAVNNPAGTYSYSTAPRFTDRKAIPPSSAAPASAITYPYTPNTLASTSFAITWGLDSKLKTPYTEAFDLSVQRELPGGFTLETAYIGRLGRHLLQSLDLAEPVDYTDPQGGGDYYTAGTALSKLVDQNGGDASASVSAIPYFEHVFPFMAGIDYPGESATQAIYSNEWAPYRANLGATTALSDIDFYCFYGCPSGYQSKFWQNQFSSLYALSTIGMSYYNAGQITLRHPMSHGFQADISYTFSRSIDMGSDTERTSEFSNGVAMAQGEILNTWKPYLNRAVSDFDTTHILTVNYVYQLPFGRGRAFVNTGGLANALVGGWQTTGILRNTSGLPFSVYEPGWTTNYQIESFGVVTDKAGAKLQRHFDSSGNPQFFANASGINSGVSSGGPIRLPYPGEAGQRNNFRGDGYFSLDSGLNKSWKIERGSVRFAWEVYNVTNTFRFDPFSIGNGLTSGSLGVASTQLGAPRRMQFSLRYDF